MAFLIEIPAAFIAVSSELSPKLPKVIIEERSMAKGRAMETLVAEAYHKSCKITYQSKPFPIRSSMYLNKNSINNTNITMKNVAIKGGMKALSTRTCIFFTRQT